MYIKLQWGRVTWIQASVFIFLPTFVYIVTKSNHCTLFPVWLRRWQNTKFNFGLTHGKKMGDICSESTLVSSLALKLNIAATLIKVWQWTFPVLLAKSLGPQLLSFRPLQRNKEGMSLTDAPNPRHTKTVWHCDHPVSTGFLNYT